MTIRDANYPTPPGLLRTTETAAIELGIQLTGEGVRDFGKLESDVAEFTRAPHGGLVVVQDPFTTIQRERIVALAARYRLPAIYPHTSFAEIGGLVSYGVNLPVMWRAAAGYIDRILRGASPGGLPVQEPTDPEIIVNLKTARSLDLTIPSTLRNRVTRLI